VVYSLALYSVHCFDWTNIVIPVTAILLSALQGLLMSEMRHVAVTVHCCVYGCMQYGANAAEDGR